MTETACFFVPWRAFHQSVLADLQQFGQTQMPPFSDPTLCLRFIQGLVAREREDELNAANLPTTNLFGKLVQWVMPGDVTLDAFGVFSAVTGVGFGLGYLFNSWRLAVASALIGFATGRLLLKKEQSERQGTVSFIKGNYLRSIEEHWGRGIFARLTAVVVPTPGGGQVFIADLLNLPKNKNDIPLQIAWFENHSLPVLTPFGLGDREFDEQSQVDALFYDPTSYQWRKALVTIGEKTRAWYEPATTPSDVTMILPSPRAPDRRYPSLQDTAVSIQHQEELPVGQGIPALEPVT